MDILRFQQHLQELKAKTETEPFGEIPVSARPQMPEFDFNRDSYVVISYSRKDFAEVYLFLAHLYNQGCRFWYDAGMLGTDKWINEFREKYENPNCLGSITFYSDNYVSNSTKEELSITFQQNGYAKQNMMISLVNVADIDPDKALKAALIADRISIENAYEIKPVLTEMINGEKERTIHRYGGEGDIPSLIDKVKQVFSIQSDCSKRQEIRADGFTVAGGILTSYTGADTELTIPNGVTEIGHEAFRNCRSLVSAVLPQGLTHIGEEAFAGCSALKQISIPDSVSTIGNGAFHECTNLESITIPHGVAVIKSNTFYFCAKLKEVVLPDSVTHIGSDAFSYCADLEHIKLPNSVAYIGKDAFCYCVVLVDVVIPSSVTHIIEGAFDNCLSLKQVVYEGTMEQWKQLSSVDSNIKKVLCTDGVLTRMS